MPNNVRILRPDKEATILGLLRRRGELSRYDIVRTTGLAPASASELTQDMIDKGYIYEAGTGESSGGRPPILLRLNPSYGEMVGVDFDASGVRALRTDFAGKVLDRRQVELDGDEDKFAVISKVAEAIRGVVSHSDGLLGIGVAVPGLLSDDGGRCIRYTSLPDFENVAVRDMLRMEFEVPVYTSWNISMLAVADQWFGEDEGIQDLICIGIRAGVGAGFVLSGTLYTGHDHRAGQFGHTTVVVGGRRCRCGKRGCLEAYCGGWAIVKRAERLLKKDDESQLNRMVDGSEDVTLNIVLQAAKDGDGLAMRVLTEAMEYLGIGIANAIEFLSPQRVVVAGSLVQIREKLEPILKDHVEKNLHGIMGRNTEVAFSRLDEYAGALGATTLVTRKVPFLSSEKDGAEGTEDVEREEKAMAGV